MFPNFLSTSKREFDYGTFYLKITLSKQSNGKYVGAMFNTNSKEEEVLFKSKSKFKITGVKKREDKAYNVFLEEVISEKHDIIMYDRLVEKEMNKANKVDNNINASDLGLIWRIIVKIDLSCVTINVENLKNLITFKLKLHNLTLTPKEMKESINK